MDRRKGKKVAPILPPLGPGWAGAAVSPRDAHKQKNKQIRRNKIVNTSPSASEQSLANTNTVAEGKGHAEVNGFSSTIPPQPTVPVQYRTMSTIQYRKSN